MGGPMTAAEFIADDTLEGLADQLGYEGAAKEAFLAQIEEYNQYCADGVDQQFGRDAQVLFPVKQAPFYAVKFEPQLGETMVTCGGRQMSSQTAVSVTPSTTALALMYAVLRSAGVSMPQNVSTPFSSISIQSGSLTCHSTAPVITPDAFTEKASS